MDWDLMEVKKLKKKQLVQFNLVMLFLFLMIVYFIKNNQPALLIGLFYVIVVVLVAVKLYTLLTGTIMGTKTSKRIEEFDRDRLGRKRWKRRRIIEALFLIAAVVFITVLLINNSLAEVRGDFSSIAFPFIGAWVGYNLGELFRMSNIEASIK